MLEVIHYEKAPKDPAKPNQKVVGHLDVQIQTDKGPFVIRRIAQLQDGEKKWFNLSSFKRKKSDGEEMYVRHCEYGIGTHNKMLLDAIPEALKKYLDAQSKPANSEYEDCPF